MKLGVVRVSTNLILEALCFPIGTEIRACIGERAPMGEIEFVIRYDGLRDLEPGAAIPHIRTTVTKLNADQPPSQFYIVDFCDEEPPVISVVLSKFYDEVCREAEARMKQSGKLEGMHYASMKTVLKRYGVDIESTTNPS